MKISKRDIGLLLGLFGILVAAIVYSMVYTPSLTEIDALEAQLVSLQQEADEYNELEAYREDYLESIVTMNKEISEIVKEFPAGILPETEIMYVVELEENVDVSIPTISYGSASVIYSRSGAAETTEDGAADVTTETTSEQVYDGITAYMIPMGLSYKTTYQGLKDLLNYTHNHMNRMIVDNISVSYDSTTGDVTGSLTTNLYYMTGTENVYSDPYVPEIELGVDNIFGTIE